MTKKEILKSVALARGRHIEALVVELPRGMLTADATEGRKSLLREEDGRSETVRKVAFARGRRWWSSIVGESPRGMLTAGATGGLEISDEKGNVEVGDRASSLITKCCILGPIAFRRRRFDSKPL